MSYQPNLLQDLQKEQGSFRNLDFDLHSSNNSTTLLSPLQPYSYSRCFGICNFSQKFMADPRRILVRRDELALELVAINFARNQTILQYAD
ncbi:hypothetical protein MUK42_36386 [Musa troglodytarum]|uniref:Uncharacterized protein n=1 Tax=Musa troglodytarum TaxID=320322 RepID=A0A9E7EGR5_9LILI|nr:hypothetical protein MUK42_36386 [Musa troglodytarum]